MGSVGLLRKTPQSGIRNAMSIGEAEGSHAMTDSLVSLLGDFLEVPTEGDLRESRIADGYPNLLACGASNELWREDLIAPDLFAKSNVFGSFEARFFALNKGTYGCGRAVGSRGE